MIQKEAGPYEFKIHIFKNDKFEQVPNVSFDEEELQMMNILGKQYDAENIKSDIIGDKLKVTFTIKE